MTVSDRFGLPVPITTFEYRSATSAITVEAAPDSAGKVIINVPAGSGMLYVSHPLGRARANVDLAQGARRELALTLEPWKFAAMSVLDATVVPGSVSADGRSVELSVEISVPTEFYRYQRPSGDGPPISLSDLTVEVPGCTARSDSTGLGPLGPRCLDAGTGTDRSWMVAGPISVGPRQIGSRAPAGPVVLMLDRSEHAGVMDFFGEQRFAAKSLVDSLLPERTVGIAAFASDGGPSGTASRLPQNPVTFYPIENPGWATSRVEVFETLDSLRDTVGGASPLQESIGAGIDYLDQRTAADERPALVVLTAGYDDSCPAPAGCVAAWRDLSGRALRAGVSVWLIAQGDQWYYAPGFPPAAPYLGREPGIRSVVAPIELSVDSAIEVARAALQGTPVVHEVRFRIESDIAGAFAPGSRVLGEIYVVDFAGDPGWGYTQALPFMAPVPAS